MRIFVAGATGAVGRELVPALIAKGHAVTGLTRSAPKANAMTNAGAQAAVADGLDAAAMTSAVRVAEPDVVIDEMTDLGAVTDLRHFGGLWSFIHARMRHQPPLLRSIAARLVKFTTSSMTSRPR